MMRLERAVGGAERYTREDAVGLARIRLALETHDRSPSEENTGDPLAELGLGAA